MLFFGWMYAFAFCYLRCFDTCVGDECITPIKRCQLFLEEVEEQDGVTHVQWKMILKMEKLMMVF